MGFDPGVGEGRPNRLRDRRERRAGERVEANREPVAVAGLRQQRPRPREVEPVRRIGVGRPQAARPERLVHDELPGEEGVRHAAVIDRVAQCRTT